jgi:hypothetical protein
VSTGSGMPREGTLPNPSRRRRVWMCRHVPGLARCGGHEGTRPAVMALQFSPRLRSAQPCSQVEPFCWTEVRAEGAR